MKNTLPFFMFFFCLSRVIYAQQNNYEVPKTIDSMLSVLSTLKEDTAKIKLLNSLSVQCMIISSYDSSLKYSNTAVQLADFIVNNSTNPFIIKAAQKGKINAYSSMGRIYYAKDLFSISIDTYFNSLKIAEEIKDTNLITDILRGIGHVYQKKGEYQKSLDYLLKALNMEEERKNKVGIASYIADIGIAYFAKGDYNNALDYYFKALKMGQDIGNENRVAAMTGCIGLTYKELASLSPEDTLKKKEYINKSLDYLNKALKKSEDVGNKYGASMWLGHIGNVYRIKGDYTKAEEYYLSTLNLNKELYVKNGEAHWHGLIGSLYAEMIKSGTYNNEKQNLFKKAEKHLLQSIALCDSLGVWNYKMQSEIAISELYASMNKNKEALEHYKNAMTAKDTLFNQEKENQITRKEDTYEFEKKIDAVKAEHDLEMAVANEKNKNQRLFWSLFTLFILGISLLSFYFYRKRENYLFKQQISELKHKALNTQISHHFISNTIVSINNFIEDNNKEEATKYLILFERLIKDVLESSAEKSITLKKDLEILKQYILLQELQFENGKLAYEITIDEGIDLENIYVCPMLFQIFVENAIEHGFVPKEKDWKLNIVINKKQGKLNCYIDDNGIGRDASGRLKSGNDKSFGIKLANELLDDVTITDLYDENNNPLGTHVEYSIPYHLKSAT